MLTPVKHTHTHTFIWTDGQIFYWIFFFRIFSKMHSSFRKNGVRLLTRCGAEKPFSFLLCFLLLKTSVVVRSLTWTDLGDEAQASALLRPSDRPRRHQTPCFSGSESDNDSAGLRKYIVSALSGEGTGFDGSVRTEKDNFYRDFWRQLLTRKWGWVFP